MMFLINFKYFSIVGIFSFFFFSCKLGLYLKSLPKLRLFLSFLFQAYTSVSKASLSLSDHRELGKMMNTIIFHTKMVDSLVEMLVETSDLSIFWYVVIFFKLEFEILLSKDTFLDYVSVVLKTV